MNSDSASGLSRMIFGLTPGKHDWLIEQFQPIINAGSDHIDGLSIEPRGVGFKCEPVFEIHGNLNPTQLRMLADAIENSPIKTK